MKHKLKIDVPEEYLGLYGKLSPHLEIINSTNENGIYGKGDEIILTLKFSSEVFVSGIPTLTVNTGCHDSSCIVNEIQTFNCSADFGKFGVRLLNQFKMNIDANTTQDAFKYKLEEFDGIQDVTVKYSDIGDNEYDSGRRICTSRGNKVTLTFISVTFPHYDGAVPLLEFDRTNSYKDIRTSRSLGDGDFLRGRNVGYEAYISPVAMEVQKGFQHQDGTAYYFTGNGTDTVYFRYIVRAHDNTSALQVQSLNFDSGYIYSAATGYNVTATVPSGVSGQRYMSSIASSLTFSKTIIISTDQPKVAMVTSSDVSGTYTQGDVVLIQVVFTLPIKAYGDGIYLLMNSGVFRRHAIFIGIKNRNTMVFSYTVQPLDTAPKLDYVDSNSLVLNGGHVYSRTQLNDTVANTTLPAPTELNSLSYSSDIKINTEAPAIVNIDILASPGTYTGGDSIYLSVTYDNAVIVTGTPRLWLNNTVTELGAYVRFAPATPTLTYYRARPGTVTEIVVSFQLNFPLQFQDEIEVYLPGFEGASASDLLLSDSTVLFLNVSWMQHSQKLIGYVAHGVAENTVIEFTVHGSSGISVPQNGLIPAVNNVQFSVKSAALVSRAFFNFQSVGAIGLSNASLALYPAMAGSSTNASISFTVPEILVVNDTITIRLDGFSTSYHYVTHQKRYVSTYPGNLFSVVWSQNTSSVILTLEYPSSLLSYNITLSSIIPLYIPTVGVGPGTVRVSTNMKNNGVIEDREMPYVTHVCAVTEVMVQFLNGTLSSPSAVRFTWRSVPTDILIGDQIIFTLPGQVVSSVVSSNKWLIGPWASYFVFSIQNSKVIFEATEVIPANTLIDVIVAETSGLIVPTVGITSNVDYFSVSLTSTECEMTSSNKIYFNFNIMRMVTNKVTFSPNHITVFNHRISYVAIELMFTLNTNLIKNDIITITLPGFDRDINIDTINNSVIASVPTSSIYDFRQKSISISLLNNITGGIQHPISINISGSSGFSLPSIGLGANHMFLSIHSSMGILAPVALSNPCVGFCYGSATYSSFLMGQDITVNFVLSFATAIVKNSVLHLDLDNFIISSNGLHIFCLKYTDSTATHINNNASSTFNATLTNNILHILIEFPFNISLQSYFGIEVVGLEYANVTGNDLVASIYGSAQWTQGYLTKSFPYPVVLPRFVLSHTALLFSPAVANTLTNASFSFVSSRDILPGYFVQLILPGFDIKDIRYGNESLVNDSASISHSFSVNNISYCRLYVRELLTAGVRYKIVIDNLLLPESGVLANASSILLSIGISSTMMTPSQSLSYVQAVPAISDTITLTFVGSTVQNLTAILVSFECSVAVHIGDTISLYIPDIMSDGADLTLNSEFSTSYSVTWKEASHMIIFSVKSTLLAGVVQLQFYASNGSRKLSFPVSGYPSGTIGAITIEFRSAITTSKNFIVPCVGICTASLKALTAKAGYPTVYEFESSFSSPVKAGDEIMLELTGFRRLSNTTMVTLTSFPYPYKTSWHSQSSQLTVTLLASSVSVTQLTFSILRDQRIILPPHGISPSQYFNISLRSSSLGYVNNSILRISSIGIIKYIHVDVFPKILGAPVTINTTFQLSNSLEVGDTIHLYLPQYSIPTGILYMSEESSLLFTAVGVSSYHTNQYPIGPIDYEGSVIFTAIQSIPANEIITLELTPSSNIELPLIGSQSRTQPSMAVVSSRCPITTVTIQNYTRVGSLINTTFIVKNNRLNNTLSFEFSAEILCTLEKWSTIALGLPGILGKDGSQSFQGKVVNSTGVFPVKFTGIWYNTP